MQLVDLLYNMLYTVLSKSLTNPQAAVHQWIHVAMRRALALYYSTFQRRELLTDLIYRARSLHGRPPDV